MTTSLPGSPSRARTSTYDPRSTPLRDAANIKASPNATPPTSNGPSGVSPYNADKRVWGGGYQAKILERTASVTGSGGGLASRLSDRGIADSASKGLPRSGSRALPTIPSSTALSSTAAHRSTSPPGSATSSWQPGHRTGSGGAASFDSIRGRFGNSLQRSDSVTSSTQTGASSYAQRHGGLAPSPLISRAASPNSTQRPMSMDFGSTYARPASPAGPSSPPGSFTGGTPTNRGAFSASSLVRSSTVRAGALHLGAMGDLAQSSVGGLRGLSDFVDSPGGSERGARSDRTSAVRRGSHKRAMTMPRLGLAAEDDSHIGSGLGHGTRHGLDRVSEASSDGGRSTQDEILIPGITSGQVDDVVGLQGRIRLSRRDGGGFGGSGNLGTSSSLASAARSTGAKSAAKSFLPSQTLKALETQRHLLQAYEYLCHVGEAKQWLETVLSSPSDSLNDAPEPASEHLPAGPYDLGSPDPSSSGSNHASPNPSSVGSPDPNATGKSGLENLSVVSLEEELRNGIALAKLARKYMGKVGFRKIFMHPKLQYRHSDNINYFFDFVAWVGLPDVFRFELVDLYNGKNLPKVIYCIHVLSHLLAKRGLAERIGNLVGKLEFSDGELEQTNAGLAGKAMPNFGNINRELAKEINEEPEPEPEPEETEEERRDRELAELRPEVVALQAQVRGFLARERLDATRYRLRLANRSVTALQSVARGALTRRRCVAALTLRRELDHWVSGFQARCQGALVRATLVRRQRHLEHYDPIWAAVQAHIRGALVRRRRSQRRRELQNSDRAFIGMQALVRAKLARQSLRATQKTLGNAQTAKNVTQLQSHVRGLLARRRFFAPIVAVAEHEQGVVGLQSVIRGALVRAQYEFKLQALEDSVPDFIRFQGHCRGVLTRRRLRDVVLSLQAADDPTAFFQARIRGALARREYARKAAALNRVEVTRGVGGLQAFARAALARKKVTTQKKELDFVQPDVRKVQAQIRGVLIRSDWLAWRDHVRSSEPTAIYLQALVRGFLFRRTFFERLLHYHDHVDKVVKVQSVFRARQQAEQYRQLTRGVNVPMSAIKNFAHLLSDSDLDYQEEIDIERLRKEVVRSIRENQQLDAHVNDLDTKIALLVKNKITLDEVQRTRRQGQTGLGHQRRNSVLAAANDPFAVVALDKGTQRKLELYQQFFYLLQTRPEYLARLFFVMGRSEMTDKAKKVVEGVVLTLFGFAQNRREEFLLLKLFQRSIHEELAGVTVLADFAKTNFTFMKLVAQYGRGAKERQYLRELLSPVVGDIVKEAALDLETDPVKIYRKIVNEEESIGGVLSARPTDVTFNQALDDADTRETFIKHLQALRALTDRFVWTISQSTPKMPFGMRYIARELFRGLSVKFRDDQEEALARVVLQIVYYRFIQPAVVAPETFDVVDSVLTPLSRKNLSEVSKMLNQISVARLFSDDIPYLTPLNNYIQHASSTFLTWFYAVIDVEDAEMHFEMDEFLDHTQSAKPTIFISPNEIYSTHSLVVKDIDRIAPTQEDPMRIVLVELGGAPSAASAELDEARHAEIALNLENKLAVRQDPNADAKALWVRTKRYVLAMLKVQPGANLLEAFLAPPTEEHEEEWARIVADEIAESQGRKGRTDASARGSLEDVHRLSFQELKARTLENVLALEKHGKLTRDDNYQGIIDSLASDIIQRNRRRIQRSGDLSALQTTLTSLKDKHKYLEEQLTQYNSYIADSMTTMQKKGHKKRFVMPFTPQWNHQRTLEKEGRKPRFGSYKYSAQRLYEKGVLLSIDQFSPRQFDRVNLIISCDEVGVFQINATYMDVPVPGGTMTVKMGDLLEAQFAGRQSISLEVAKLNLELLLYLINRKFYV